ncbi:MAG: S8 family serine peptidase [Deltaproteobacteria bacterium]|nr:S8 family serine peptidase [Deltaproteobacteria bacterium]
MKSKVFLIFIFLLISQKAWGETRVLIRMQEGGESSPSVLQGLSLNENSSFSQSNYLPATDVHVLEIEGSDDIPQELENFLNNSPEVLYWEEDKEIVSHYYPNDPYYERQWAGQDIEDFIGIESTWGLIRSAPDVSIALLDSGCDLNHPDLAPNLWTNPGEIASNQQDEDHNGYIDDYYGYDFVNRDSTPQDDNGHGTMVFGIMAAQGDNGQGIAGVVWDTNVLCLKVLNENEVGRLSFAIEAIEYAVNAGVDIINTSWGFADDQGGSPILEEAITLAQEAGIIFVASAGNNGTNNDPMGQGLANYPSSYQLDNIIAVAATDSHDTLADFSNYNELSVDLAAPGVGILTTAPGGYTYFTGTSASAPFVSGVAALLLSMNPQWGYQEVIEHLLVHTDYLPELEDKTLSQGRLNLYKATSTAQQAANDSLEGGSDSDGDQELVGFNSQVAGCQLQSQTQGQASTSYRCFYLMGLMLYIAQGLAFKRIAKEKNWGF